MFMSVHQLQENEPIASGLVDRVIKRHNPTPVVLVQRCTYMNLEVTRRQYNDTLQHSQFL